MHTPGGRRDFLKQLAAVAGGLWWMPELMPGAEAGHVGAGHHPGLASPRAS